MNLYPMRERMVTTMTDDIFVNENLNHPENRINVALFGLLSHDWLKNWLLSQLGLPVDAIIYPPENQRGVRPDFKIASGDGHTLAWVEVELGKDPAQVARYRELLDEPIKTIWGRKSDGADLSLEEIADYLLKRCARVPTLSTQSLSQVQHLVKQIEQALEGHSSSYQRRDEVSETMRNHPLVLGLVDRLGSRLRFTTGSVPIGSMKADTNGPEGFSLRVNSRVATQGTLSLLAISGGRPGVIFPAEAKLRRYLPAHRPQIEAYVSLLQQCGIDLSSYSENQRPTLPYDYLLGDLDKLAKCLIALADRPSGSTSSSTPLPTTSSDRDRYSPPPRDNDSKTVQNRAPVQTSYQSRNNVSEEMQNHPLVSGLVERLGSKLKFTTGPVPIGFLKADTNGPRGFSLRVNSRAAAQGTLSLLAVSGGRPGVLFPSRPKLRKYLPAHGPQIDAYVSLIRRCGRDLSDFSETQRPSLHYEYLLDEFDELADCLLALADRPSPTN